MPGFWFDTITGVSIIYVGGIVSGARARVTISGAHIQKGAGRSETQHHCADDNIMKWWNTLKATNFTMTISTTIVEAGIALSATSKKSTG